MHRLWTSLSVIERASLVVVVLVTVIAIAGPWLAPYDPFRVDHTRALLPPGGEHLLGTDAEGRDILSRVLTGARQTLLSTFVVVLVALLVGAVIGTVAGLARGWLDEILMRVTDIGLAYPAIILALGFAAAMGAGLQSVVIALCLTWWPGYARLVRSLVRETSGREFVESAKALGVSRRRLVFKHVLPNSLDTLYVQTTLDVAQVALVISGLSFVGVGARPPSAEWGAMIAGGREYITTGWWIVTFPGLALALTALAFSLLGDGLRVLNDPSLRKGSRS